jgi:arylsulfatase A-like enzyme
MDKRQHTRRDFIKTVGGAAASGAFAFYSGVSFTSCSSGAKRLPNVVLVLTDDQGYGDLGCHGNDKIRTPHLDGFYEQSVRFTNFYVCPLCSPTRASLLTGRYNYRTGVIDTWVGWAMLRPDEVTLAEILRGTGYRTGIFGKWHLGDHFPLRPVDQGFEECLIHKGAGIGGRANPPENRYYDPILFHNEEPKEYRGYCTDIFFTSALEFIEDHRDEPFFAFIPTNVPHVPLEIKDEDVAPYTAMGLDEITAKHYAMLTNLDDNFGRLIEKLTELGLADDTIVIFMSDNGPAYGDRRYNAGLREAKGSVYDGGIRVPFFIRWPKKLPPGVDIDRIAAHIDVLPTVLSLCGAPPPQNVQLDGISLAPLLLNEAADWPDRTLFFQQCRPDREGINRPRLFTNCAARSQRYKIVMTSRDRRRRQTEAIGFEETELFDMIRDPNERTDIAGDHPDIVRRMRAAYEKWFKDVTRNLTPVPVGLGSPEENPVLLTNQDIFGPGAATSYSSWSRMSRNPEEEPDGYGVWNVKVIRSGRYRITLSLDPVGKDVTVPLKAGKAVFMLGASKKSEDIVEGSTKVNLELRLDEIEGAIETYFTGQRRDGKKITPFFIEVEYLGPE